MRGPCEFLSDTFIGTFAELRHCPRELWVIYSLKVGPCAPAAANAEETSVFICLCRRVAHGVGVAQFLESYAYYTISYSLLLYLSNEFGFSDSEAGWIYGITGLLVSVYGFVVGPWGPRGAVAAPAFLTRSPAPSARLCHRQPGRAGFPVPRICHQLCFAVRDAAVAA